MVWLHFHKKQLKSYHRKLHHLQYGPYKIIKKVGEFEHNLPPFLGIHPIFDIELLKTYFPLLLDITKVVEEIIHKELNPEVVNPLQSDQIIEFFMNNLRN